MSPICTEAGIMPFNWNSLRFKNVLCCGASMIIGNSTFWGAACYLKTKVRADDKLLIGVVPHSQIWGENCIRCHHSAVADHNTCPILMLGIVSTVATRFAVECARHRKH